MLALFIKETHTELDLSTGRSVHIPHSDLDVSGLDAAVRYAYHSGLITHEDYLRERDALMGDIDAV